MSPGLFRTLGTPLIAGRDFTWADIHGERLVAIVSESMAREMWGQVSSALGKRIRVGRVGAWNEIIGVVGDVYDSGVDRKAPPIVYWRAGVQRGPVYAGDYVPRATTLAIRSKPARSDDLVSEVSKAVWAVNPNLPLARVRHAEGIHDRCFPRCCEADVLEKLDTR